MSLSIPSCPHGSRLLQFDPSTPRTVIDIQNARIAAAAAAATSTAKVNGTVSTSSKKRSREEEDSEDVDSGNDDEEGDDEDDVDDIQVNGFSNNDKMTAGNEGDPDEDDDDPSNADRTQPTNGAGQPSISDLRAKLQARMAEVSNKGASATSSWKTKAIEGDDNDSVTSENASRDALLEERRKKRGEMRDKRRRERKAQIKQEKEQGLPSKKERDNDAIAAAFGAGALPSTSAAGKPGAMSDVKKALKKAGKKTAVLPAHDDEDDDPPSSAMVVSQPTSTSASLPLVPSTALAAPSSVAFSSLDFTPTSAIQGPDATKLTKKQREALSKSTRLGVTSHDPTVALGALNKREEFLSKLNPQARERAEEKDKWERMGMRAEGTKVYDDETKLKKMVKRKEKAKAKSSKEW